MSEVKKEIKMEKELIEQMMKSEEGEEKVDVMSERERLELLDALKTKWAQVSSGVVVELVVE